MTGAARQELSEHRSWWSETFRRLAGGKLNLFCLVVVILYTVLAVYGEVVYLSLIHI